MHFAAVFAKKVDTEIVLFRRAPDGPFDKQGLHLERCALDVLGKIKFYSMIRGVILQRSDSVRRTVVTPTTAQETSVTLRIGS
jgi:hypothetical protein